MKIRSVRIRKRLIKEMFATVDGLKSKEEEYQYDLERSLQETQNINKLEQQVTKSKLMKQRGNC